MKKATTFFAFSLFGLLFLFGNASQAEARSHTSFGFGMSHSCARPVYYAPCYQAPVIVNYAPAYTYYAPAPAYAPAPVYAPVPVAVYPATYIPTVVYPAPVYVRPAPRSSFFFSWGVGR